MAPRPRVVRGPRSTGTGQGSTLAPAGHGGGFNESVRRLITRRPVSGLAGGTSDTQTFRATFVGGVGWSAVSGCTVVTDVPGVTTGTGILPVEGFWDISGTVLATATGADDMSYKLALKGDPDLPYGETGWAPVLIGRPQSLPIRFATRLAIGAPLVVDNITVDGLSPGDGSDVSASTEIDVVGFSFGAPTS